MVVKLNGGMNVYDIIKKEKLTKTVKKMAKKKLWVWTKWTWLAPN